MNSFFGILKSKEAAAGNPLLCCLGSGFNAAVWQPMHIYFTSNDEIRRGVTVLCTLGGINHVKVVQDVTSNGQKSLTKSAGWKVVEASTDKSLGVSSIPESFLKSYVNRYGNINKVRLEQIWESEVHKQASGQADIDRNNDCLVLKLTDKNEVVVVDGALSEQQPIRIEGGKAHNNGDGTFSITPLRLVDGSPKPDSLDKIEAKIADLKVPVDGKWISIEEFAGITKKEKNLFIAGYKSKEAESVKREVEFGIWLSMKVKRDVDLWYYNGQDYTTQQMHDIWTDRK